MKKVIGILMVLITVCMIGISIAEGEHYIFDDVYPFWKELYSNIVDICNDYYTGDDQEFIHDGYYYMVGYELGLQDGYTYNSYKEYENIIEEVFKEHGIKHVKCNVYQIGKGNTMNVLYMEINTLTKLREVEDCVGNYMDYDDGSDVYGIRAIYYEHIQ